MKYDESYSINLWKKAAAILLICTLMAAVILAMVLNVAWNTHEALLILLLLGAPLVVGITLSRASLLPSFANFLTIFSLMVLLSFVGAALAMLGTRSPVELADPWLAAADSALMVSAMEIVVSTQQLPSWAISGLVKSYLHTGSIFFFTLVALHLLNREALVWRIFLIWGWSFLTVALMAFAAPAIGCFSQLSDDQVTHLPRNAGRYAIRKFVEFRNAADPVLEIDRLGGVITFPSLHTVTALMIAQAWHRVRILGPVTKVLTAIIILSCVPVGGHYVVDLFAGIAVWWGTTLAVDRMGTRFATDAAPESNIATAA